MVKYTAAFVRRVNTLLLRWRGVRIGKGALVGKLVNIPRNAGSISIGAGTYIDDYGALLSYTANGHSGRISLGNQIYGNRYLIIDCIESVSIGDGTKIGPFVFITDHNYNTAIPGKLDENDLVSSPVTIGKNVWIGAHAVIMKGATIGDSAIIAAGAVVTGAIPAGSKAKGIPARY
ncbi:acyltransferase [Flavihumibacter sp. CACIAM 22H1]|uniref:acyltransferase n=1 Tax=Flavihumibacter sp. CACIAM 22H1 TaxID=1812911 RepID=UPI0007A83232|nr:acyltransferase [Flavihumibacter sp. CACIAM 22H1]KYP13649.1 MAG: hypothetical protein A1D16_17960 [Flavihumibacter sp. CACIAM 22H1]